MLPDAQKTSRNDEQNICSKYLTHVYTFLSDHLASVVMVFFAFTCTLLEPFIAMRNHNVFPGAVNTYTDSPPLGLPFLHRFIAFSVGFVAI